MGAPVSRSRDGGDHARRRGLIAGERGRVRAREAAGSSHARGLRGRVAWSLRGASGRHLLPGACRQPGDPPACLLGAATLLLSAQRACVTQLCWAWGHGGDPHLVLGPPGLFSGAPSYLTSHLFRLPLSRHLPYRRLPRAARARKVKTQNILAGAGTGEGDGVARIQGGTMPAREPRQLARDFVGQSGFKGKAPQPDGDT